LQRQKQPFESKALKCFLALGDAMFSGDHPSGCLLLSLLLARGAHASALYEL
jgi:hypothetical protein